MRMKETAIIAAAILILSASWAGAGDENSYGYNHITIPANTEVPVSIPFTQKAEGTYTVNTKVADTGVTVSGSPFTADEYNDMYYVRFTKKGYWTTITDTGTNQLNFENTDILDNIVAGDEFKIYPHHTLESVFPDSKENESFIASTGSGLNLTINTKVLMWEDSVGNNQSPTDTYYWHEDGEWRKFGDSGNFDDTIIDPDDMLAIRNTSEYDLDFRSEGYVYKGALAITLSRSAASDNDTQTTTGWPVPIKLKDMGLGGTDAFESSTGSGLGLVIKDKLLVWDNSDEGTNKSPKHTYYYHEDGEWRKFGQSGSFNDTKIDPSAGILIRSVSGASVEETWTSNAPY